MMINQEIEPNDCYCLVMKHAELEDLIKCTRFFSETEAQFHLQKRWQLLLDDLINVRRQIETHHTPKQLERMDLEELR